MPVQERRLPRLVIRDSRASGSPPRHETRPRLLPDPARYACGCGHAFRADVSTHVACPKCGDDQAW